MNQNIDCSPNSFSYNPPHIIIAVVHVYIYMYVYIFPVPRIVATALNI